MTDYLNIRGDAVSREKTTVGRFYQAVYQSGNVYAVRRTTSRGGSPHFIVEKILHNEDGYSAHQVGDVVSCFSAQVYKFKQVPDTVRYRGKQVTSQEQLTVGRWYILIDRDGEVYSGQYANKQQGPCILFTLDDESAIRRGRGGRFAVNMDGTSLRKVYKFTQVPKATPKPEQPVEQPVVADVVSPTGFPYGTRAVDIGAKEGDKFMFVDMPLDPRKDITVGTIFTLSCDDGSRCPWFKDENGHEKCLHWERLAPYVPPVPATEPEPIQVQEAANDDVWDDIPIGPKPDPVVFEKAMEAVDLQRAARAIGLLANEVQKRYEVAQEAVKAHTVAVQALENAQRDLIELAKKATANETI